MNLHLYLVGDREVWSSIADRKHPSVPGGALGWWRLRPPSNLEREWREAENFGLSVVLRIACLDDGSRSGRLEYLLCATDGDGLEHRKAWLTPQEVSPRRTIVVPPWRVEPFVQFPKGTTLAQAALGATAYL